MVQRRGNSWLGKFGRWGLVLIGCLSLGQAFWLLLQQQKVTLAALHHALPVLAANVTDLVEHADVLRQELPADIAVPAEAVSHEEASELLETVPTSTTRPPGGCPASVLEEFLPEKNDADKNSKRKAKLCKLGETYGCADGRMWATSGCWGAFDVLGKATVCGADRKDLKKVGGRPDKKKNHSCAAGEMQEPSSSCGLMLLTTYFTDKKDWQRQKKYTPDFGQIHRLYRTAMKNGLNVTVLYDELPAEMRQQYQSSTFVFHQVDLSDYDRRYGVNDVRYFLFDRLVQEHTNWRFVFIIDAFDVVVGMNPCEYLEKESKNEGALFVGGELDKLGGHPWMKARYERMGGKYKKWFKTMSSKKTKILNCGITGGKREVMQNFLKEMKAVISDPNLTVRANNAKAAEEGKKGEDIHVNMAALNYLADNGRLGTVVTGAPVHSKYKKYETDRTNVWFVHK